MKYITLSNLVTTIRNNIYKIPHDIDFVIGIPRSGMICASIISEFINVPLIDINGFINGQELYGGRRLAKIDRKNNGKILVIDDTVFSGASINEVKDKLNKFNYNFIYCAVYLEGYNDKAVDFWLEDLRKYTHNFTQLVMYEWNIFHHNLDVMSTFIFDLDGVFCIDPCDERNTKAYEKYITNAIPLFTPTVKVGKIMTYRLIKYKLVTEDWLAKNNIQYEKLIMFNANSWDERNNSGIEPAIFKGNFYKNDDAKLFIESDNEQAKKIYEISKKPVLCISTNFLYGGE